jgi:tRNA threonylcarbamoyladenosine modification (KEOPS) complex Cgi121 subunit
LLFELAEFGSKVWISSFSGKVDAASVMREVYEKFPNATVQLFDLDRIAGSRHLFLAAYNAEKSYNSKRRIARSLQMETLLFVSGTRQITEALERVGISKRTARSAVLVIAPSDEVIMSVANLLIEKFNRKDDDRLLDIWTKQRRVSVQRVFGIGMKELKATCGSGEVGRAIEKLAIERSAMLAVAK